jgi:hypothetical protein
LYNPADLTDQPLCLGWSTHACRPEDITLGGTAPIYPEDYIVPPPLEGGVDFDDNYQPPAATSAGVGWQAPETIALPDIHPTGWQCWRERTIEPGYTIDPNPTTRPDPPLILRTYTLVPSIEIIRLSDSSPILADTARLRADLDSWGWSITFAPSRGADRDLIQPVAGDDVEIQMTINGYSWTGVVRTQGRTKVRDARGNPQYGYTAGGESLSTYHSAAYAPTRNRTQEQTRTAAQLAAEELAGTGWTLDWQTQDWTIPGGVFTYQDLTPLQAVSRLADAVGAVVQSDPATETLIVRPRYLISPWDWETASIDAILTENIITRLGASTQSSPTYNAVWVIGREQGVIVEVRKDGTAGDVVAPQVIEDLCADHLAGQERGRNILAKSGRWETVTLELPLFPASPPGFIKPGMLLEVQEAAETWIGQCTSLEIAASRTSALEVYQTITVERWHG